MEILHDLDEVKQQHFYAVDFDDEILAIDLDGELTLYVKYDGMFVEQDNKHFKIEDYAAVFCEYLNENHNGLSERGDDFGIGSYIIKDTDIVKEFWNEDLAEQDEKTIESNEVLWIWKQIVRSVQEWAEFQARLAKRKKGLKNA